MGVRGSDIISDMFAAPLVLGLLVSVVSGGVIISQDKEQERLLNLLPGPLRYWTSLAASCRGKRPQQQQQLLLVEDCWGLVFLPNHAQKLQQQPQQLRPQQQQPQQQHVEDSWEAVSYVNNVLSISKNFY